MTDAATRVGVVGVGALGQHHARIYTDLPGATLCGVYDTDPTRRAECSSRFGCRGYDSLDELAEDVDAASVAVPTVSHREVAGSLLESGRDVLVEKPIATTIEEADALVRLAREGGRILQVGHVERFNPALDAYAKLEVAPRFIEVHRLGVFTGRSLDIDVILDLMIHDIDIVLSMDRSRVAQLDAVGVRVLTDQVDIANARLRLESGLIANLTASRVSWEEVRKFRIFAPQTYVSFDFAQRSCELVRVARRADGTPDISIDRGSGSKEEPLKRQLAAFVDSVRSRRPARVSGEDGRRALELAQQITDAMLKKDALEPH